MAEKETPQDTPPESASTDWRALAMQWKERALSASPMAKVIGLTLAGVAIAGVMVAQTSGGIRVAVSGAGADGVFRATDIEAALAGGLSPSAVDGVTIDASGLNADIHASSDYRAQLVKVMAKRAVAAC